MKKQGTLGFSEKKTTGPIECLGQTFPNDEARREHYLRLLAEKLRDPEFRKTPGFPKGTDEDILRLSDPPYYTACPNPFLRTFTKAVAPRRKHPQPEEAVVPFAADVTEGKGEHFYNVHTYHTKVPYRAIARFLLHYTRPGDIVLDAFCGTGMVGLAAQACSSSQFVRDLGLQIDDANLGSRCALLVDLSPAATHIAANYNQHVVPDEFEKEANRILDDFRSTLGWMFTTDDPGTQEKCPVDFYVWSDVFGCPECGGEVVFWDAGVEEDTGYKKASKDMVCPKCGASNSRDDYQRILETYFDDLLGKTCQRQKEELIRVAYQHRGKHKEKEPTEIDHAVLARVRQEPIGDPVPIRKMMDRDGPWGDMYRAGYHVGITHFHHFYYRRSLRAVAWLWQRVHQSPPQVRMRLRWWLQSVGIGHTRMNRYFTSSYSQVNRYLKGFLYIAQVRSEVAPWYSLRGKVARMVTLPPGKSLVGISTGTATDLNLDDDSVDYIFTDPPFGGNIIYSELNFMWEAWFGVTTDQEKEAIVSTAQGKSLADYERLMERSFHEYFRVLKPGHWITIVFHNSHNAVWMAIQMALQRAGFVVADVRVFDKKQLTMKQQTAAGTVQKDLLITAYRPSELMASSFDARQGSSQGVWEFVRGHLAQLPVVVQREGGIEQLSERMNFLLFDRMVAFYVEKNIPVPMSAADFYAGLVERFPRRDEMYFLEDQVAIYDRARARFDDVAQLSIFVTDEATAVQWVRQQLQRKPQSYQELVPQFMQQLQAWAKHEKTIELKEILTLNFFCYDGSGPVPSQVHSYLSSNFKDLRNLGKDDPTLKAKARDRWYVPDPSKEADLEKLRLRTLLKEFEDYRASTGRKLKQFRTEAVRAGFKHCYDGQDYQTIVDVAAKLPEQVIQEDEKLLMYFDVATMRLGVEG